MAKHSGKNGVVKLGGDTTIGLKQFSIDETTSQSDIVDADSTWEDFDFTQTGWKGTIDMNLDHGADGQTLRAGDVVTFEGYTEGDSSGKTYLSGSIGITDHGVASSVDGTVARKYGFRGKGALASQVVS